MLENWQEREDDFDSEEKSFFNTAMVKKIPALFMYTVYVSVPLIFRLSQSQATCMSMLELSRPSFADLHGCSLET